jgi:hypothetical protein
MLANTLSYGRDSLEKLEVKAASCPAIKKVAREHTNHFKNKMLELFFRIFILRRVSGPALSAGPGLAVNQHDLLKLILTSSRSTASPAGQHTELRQRLA